MSSMDEIKIRAIQDYIDNFLKDPWDYSEGDEMWCKGYRVALMKIQGMITQPIKGMKVWGTEVHALDPIEPERGIIVYGGPNVQALTKEKATEYCQTHGLGYCKVIDELVGEVPCKPGTYESDWDRYIDYEQPTDN